MIMLMIARAMLLLLLLLLLYRCCYYYGLYLRRRSFAVVIVVFLVLFLLFMIAVSLHVFRLLLLDRACLVLVWRCEDAIEQGVVNVVRVTKDRPELLPPALNRAKAQHACVLRPPERGGAGCQFLIKTPMISTPSSTCLG